MAKILVTGASGFVGRVLIKALNSRDFNVVGVGRKQIESVANTFFVVPDFSKHDVWKGPLQGCDVVIHLAARVHIMQDHVVDPLKAFLATNLQATTNLAKQAAQAGVKRFVYVSSVKVNGEMTGNRAFTDLNEVNPQDPYSVSKWEAEKALHQISERTGLEVVIVRPPLVYGSGVKGNFAQMISVIAQGVPLPLAAVNNLRSLIYVENLVDALILCANHPGAVGQTYLVSDGEDISTPDLLRKLGNAMGRPARLFFCPLALLKLAGRLVGKIDQIDRLTGSLQVDSSKIRRELAWQPPFTLDDGLQATAKMING